MAVRAPGVGEDTWAQVVDAVIRAGLDVADRGKGDR